jgi:hypothetical protein
VTKIRAAGRQHARRHARTLRALGIQPKHCVHVSITLQLSRSPPKPHRARWARLQGPAHLATSCLLHWLDCGFHTELERRKPSDSDNDPEPTKEHLQSPQPSFTPQVKAPAEQARACVSCLHARQPSLLQRAGAHRRAHYDICDMSPFASMRRCCCARHLVRLHPSVTTRLLLSASHRVKAI